MQKAFSDTLLYLYSLIPQDKNWVFSGQKGLERTKYLLSLLGNPQNKLKVIHIAGTSGKGSTAFYLSHLLHAVGQKVGLHVSPHLLDIRERFQINNKFISNTEFTDYVNKMKPLIETVIQSAHGLPTYFEVLVCLAYYIFADKKVDYAVMETGFGGWYDATNTVDRADKLSLITSIGLDHTHVLGKTVAEIAYQKAKIIIRDGVVIVQENSKVIRNIIEKEVKQKSAHIFYLPTSLILSSVNITADGLYFDFIFQNKIYKRVILPTHALYQAENVSMALAAMHILSQRDKFLMDEKIIRNILSKTHFSGRMEELNIKEKKIILDGAHNPQKMKAFIGSLQKAYPNKKFHFVVAFKKDKDIKNMMKMIYPRALTITVTRFKLDTQDLRHTSKKTSDIIAYFPKRNVEEIEDPKKAFDFAMRGAGKGEVVVVTGSLYLLSILYNHIHAYTSRK